MKTRTPLLAATALLGAIAFSAAGPSHARARGPYLMSTLPDGPDYGCTGTVTASPYALGCRHKQTRDLVMPNRYMPTRDQIAYDRYIDDQIIKGECKQIPFQTIVRIIEIDPGATGICVADMGKLTDTTWPLSEEELATRRYWIQPRTISTTSFDTGHPLNEREYWNLKICPR